LARGAGATASTFGGGFLGEIAHRLCLAALLALPGGCSLTFIDEDGRKHVLGLVHMTIAPADEQTAGDVVGVQTLGLSIYETPIHSGISLGWHSEKTAALKNNVLVIGNPISKINPE
jgi:hypothetical protein